MDSAWIFLLLTRCDLLPKEWFLADFIEAEYRRVEIYEIRMEMF